MFEILVKLKEERLSSFCAILLITLLPISILSSSILINVSVIIISFIFLVLLFKQNNYEIFKDKLFLFLFLFWILMLINLLSSINFQNSLPRTIGFFRFLIFIPALIYFVKLKKFEFLRIILTFWLFIFILISFDLLFEYIFGKNILGFSSYMPGRLSGVLNDELKIGNYYLGFYFISVASIITYFKKNNYLILLSIIFFTIISLLIGERANFIKIFVGLIIFLFFWDQYKIKHKIYAIGVILILLTSVLSLNSLSTSKNKLSTRFNEEFIGYIFKNGIVNYYYNSQYGAHYSTALKIYKNFPYTGIGIKNFWEECGKEKYYDKRFIATEGRCSTHPHQFHLEILSELGVFGYFLFVIFFIYFLTRGIINYKQNKNILHLGSLIFVFVSIFLPIPTGSFFTTYGATIFWINFSLVLIFEKELTK